MIVDDFKGREGNWVASFRLGKSVVRTTSGSKYYNMLNRCSTGDYIQKHQPTYIGCDCNFTSFKDFANWHVVQIGYNCGWELDKDMLTPDNKIYSKETCILLPKCLNMFLRVRQSKVSFLPVGVYTHQGKYKSVTIWYGKFNYLGIFNTPLKKPSTLTKLLKKLTQEY